MSKVDHEIFQNFLEESDDLLNEVETCSVALESAPDDLAQVNGIFRAVHSLKGNSSFFGLEDIRGFCHAFESFLGLIREKTLEISPPTVNIIIEGSDHLKTIFSRLFAAEGQVILTGAEKKYLRILEDKTEDHTEEGKREKLRTELIRLFAKFEAEGELDGSSPAGEIYELIKTLAPELVQDRRASARDGGSTWMCGELDVTREYTDLVIFLQNIKTGGEMLNVYSSFMASLTGMIEKHEKEGVEEPLTVLRELEESFDMFYQEEFGVDDVLAVIIDESLNEYSGYLKEIKKSEPKEEAAISAGANGNGSEKMVRAVKTVKINEGLLDKFIEHVGELITINELFNNFQHSLGNGVNSDLALDFRNTNLAFHELSEQMRVSLYEIRKAPLEMALGKLPRIVRDISRRKGKSISITHTGGEIEVDKSLHGKIETMLVHCVRNSADHGLESSEERMAAGKDAEGKINIEITSGKNRVRIKVADDGRGVDVPKVKRLAVERGFVSEKAADALSENDALNLLLAAGFSTVQEVTETSGRGVGMDVLSSSVREMDGEMSLQNEPGRGLTINISLPLAYTTRIKLGLTMRVGDNAFLIPAESVRESFRASREDVSMVEGKGEMVQRWGNIYPLVRLSKLFSIVPEHKEICDSICVQVESRGTTVCLVVDEMLGQRQIVYKELTVRTKEPCAFEGVTILDSRRMALILSVDGIIKQFRE